jgi:hypothetical protein
METASNEVRPRRTATAKTPVPTAVFRFLISKQGPNRPSGIASHFLTKVLILSLAQCLSASSILIDFEGFTDGTFISTQFPGLTFSNAQILTAGISLNEFEFPPKSGVNVVADAGGPMSISFATPVISFGGFFTYTVPFTIAAFDGTDAQIALATAMFTNNEALSGVSGSSPNEFIQVTSAGGISRVTMTGDPNGGSFTLDDATFTPMISAAPAEPATLLLVLLAAPLFMVLRKTGNKIRSTS